MRRPYGRRHKSLQSAFPSAAALHHRSTDPHQCSHFLPLTRSRRYSTNCILCLSIKIYFPFLFSFAFYHLLLIPLLLKSSLSLLAHVMRAGLLKLIPSDPIELDRKCWPGSAEPLGILHNALLKREGFCCHPNHTFHLYEQIAPEKLNLASELGRVKVTLPLRAIQESQNKLVKHYRDDGVRRNKTTP